MAPDTHAVIEEEATELSLQEIYQQLMVTNELILTIPAEEEQPLRKGLAMVKSKQNTKMKESGIQPDKLTLQYTVTPHLDSKRKVVPDVVDIHIVLAPRSGITVLSMKVPDPSI